MNAGAATTRHRPDAGVTLIEILIVTVIIALMAALAFPVYKIVQQREKERRLKKILNDVRAAISGGKSQLANTWLSEGFRTYVFQTGKRKIIKAYGGNELLAKDAISSFTENLVKSGRAYPLSPSHFGITDYEFLVATGPGVDDNVSIRINRRFIRHIPNHPFQSWYHNATWTFRPAQPPDSAPIPSQLWNPTIHKGVSDINSSGAGMALDGSNTDDW